MHSSTPLRRSLRKSSTPAEQKLWGILRRRELAGYKFRRQHPIGPYVVDFYCASGKLVVEVDGDVHALEDSVKHDQ